MKYAGADFVSARLVCREAINRVSTGRNHHSEHIGNLCIFADFLKIVKLDMQESKLQSIEQAIEDLKAGKFVILVDDEERENEGDFIIAAQHIDADKVNFMLTNGRGVLCVPMTGERCRELDLEMHLLSPL